MAYLHLRETRWSIFDEGLLQFSCTFSIGMNQEGQYMICDRILNIFINSITVLHSNICISLANSYLYYSGIHVGVEGLMEIFICTDTYILKSSSLYVTHLLELMKGNMNGAVFFAISYCLCH